MSDEQVRWMDKSVLDLELHEEADIGGYWAVLRVPGGWVYTQHRDTGAGGTMIATTFVPLTNGEEF